MTRVKTNSLTAGQYAVLTLSWASEQRLKYLLDLVRSNPNKKAIKTLNLPSSSNK